VVGPPTTCNTSSRHAMRVAGHVRLRTRSSPREEK
jgi:hypothetical protein